MNKYLILAISTISTIHSMEYVNLEPQDTFTNLTVLDYDGNAHNACYIAQTAKIVHSDTTGKNLTDITTNQKNYAHVNNLIFTTPQTNIYDAVTIYNPNILNKKSMIYHLCDMHKHLKLNGELHALIQTQTHYPPICDAAFLTLYPQIYQSLSSETLQQLKQKHHPSAITLQSIYFTDERAKDTIWSSGYDVISSKEITYEIIMHTAEIKKLLKSNILEIIKECEFSEETQKSLYKQFISLFFNQCKRNNKDQIIIPSKATKIHLRNATGGMRLRLNWNPCWGPKELYTKK